MSLDFPLLNDERVDFRVNINNVLDETYISESDTNNFAEPGETLMMVLQLLTEYSSVLEELGMQVFALTSKRSYYKFSKNRFI